MTNPNLNGYQIAVAAITATRDGTEPRSVLDALLVDLNDPAERAIVATAAAELAVSTAAAALDQIPPDDADEVLRHMGTAIAHDIANEEGEPRHDHD